MHAATLDETRWPATSALIDEACGLTGNGLMVAEGPTNDVRALFVGLYARGQRRDDLEREYLTTYHPLDERVPRFRQLPARHLVHITDLYTAEELKTSRTYNELLPRAGMQDSLNVQLPGLAGSHIGWGLNDPVDAEGWGSSRITMVERLLPHIQQFVRVRQVLAGAGALGASLADLLAATGLGIIQVDGRGRIAAANDRALALLRTGEGLVDQDGVLCADVPADDAVLRRCCMKTLRGGALLVTLRRSHTIGMQSKVHPTYKTKYRVANWPAYNQALVRRGDVTVWLSSEAIAAWTPGRSGRRGGQRRYSDLAIEAALTLRLLYHLPLRQAEGFLHALFGMMRLNLSAPDYTTLSRRSQHLRRRLRPIPPGEGLHLVLDSTGLSIVGAGEWAAAKHGGRGRRGWRKLHLGVDQSGVIRVHTLTEETGDDATTGLDLLNAVEGPLVRVTADAAYDTVAVYETAGARGATVVVPPARTANVSGHGPRSPARDRTITLVKQLGRRQWKKVSGYHRQSRVENAFFRYKSIIGDSLRARSPAGQGSEAVLGCEILNRMTALGRPVSYRIGR